VLGEPPRRRDAGGGGGRGGPPPARGQAGPGTDLPYQHCRRFIAACKEYSRTPGDRCAGRLQLRDVGRLAVSGSIHADPFQAIPVNTGIGAVGRGTPLAGEGGQGVLGRMLTPGLMRGFTEALGADDQLRGEACKVHFSGGGRLGKMRNGTYPGWRVESIKLSASRFWSRKRAPDRGAQGEIAGVRENRVHQGAPTKRAGEFLVLNVVNVVCARDRILCDTSFDMRGGLADQRRRWPR